MNWKLSMIIISFCLTACTSLAVFPDKHFDGDTSTDSLIDLDTDPGDDIPADGIMDTAMDTSHETMEDAEDVIPDGEAGVIGDACTTESDCEGVSSPDVICLLDIMSMVTFPGGYCSVNCESSVDCGPGADCVGFTGASYCLLECTENNECRESEGYECAEPPIVGGDLYCVPSL